MKSIRTILTISLLIFIMIASISCGGNQILDEKKIENRIEVFQKAYNAGDFEEMIKNFDMKSRKKFELTFALMDGLLGTITGTDFVSMSNLFGLAAVMSEEDLINFDIEEIDIDETKEKATVKAIMKYGNSYFYNSEDCNIILVKEKDDWFISDVQEINQD